MANVLTLQAHSRSLKLQGAVLCHHHLHHRHQFSEDYKSFLSTLKLQLTTAESICQRVCHSQRQSESLQESCSQTRGPWDTTGICLKARINNHRAPSGKFRISSRLPQPAVKYAPCKKMPWMSTKGTQKCSTCHQPDSATHNGTVLTLLLTFCFMIEDSYLSHPPRCLK